MRIARSLLIVIGTISVLAFLFLGVGLYLTTRPPRLQAQITPIVPTAPLAKRFDDILKTFKQKVEQPEFDGSISITITQEEATSKLVEVLRRADLPVEVKSAVLNFKDGRILGLGSIVYMNLAMNVGIIVSIEIDSQGKPRLVVEETDIGRGAFLPPGVASQLLSLIPSMEMMQAYLDKLPLMLKDVVIKDGRLTVTGTMASAGLRTIGIGQKVSTTT